MIKTSCCTYIRIYKISMCSYNITDSISITNIVKINNRMVIDSFKNFSSMKFSFWRLLRNLVIGVAAVICIIAMGSKGASGGLQERYFVGMYRINDTNYYTNSDSFLMRWYWYELWQDMEEEDIRIHRFPEGTIPTWSEDQQAFFYFGENYETDCKFK